ncbi:MAG: hypothetical protein GWN07_24840, partial [Actinobacteria bacterium]|nr:hypothetical protein [Actinomycetota bacterium]NIX22879.1 hypothetical protein [Actinomycetota bacterium]
MDAYLDGCAASDQDLDYCRCTIEQFERRLTLEEFLAIDDLEGGVVLEVAAACMDQAAGPAGSEASGTVLPGVLRSHTDATVADVEAYWADTLPALYGTAYRPVGATVPYFPSTGDL